MRFYRVLFLEPEKYGGRLGEALLCQTCRDLHDEKIAAAIVDTRWDEVRGDGFIVWGGNVMFGAGIDKQNSGAVGNGGAVRCDDCGGMFSILRSR